MANYRTTVILKTDIVDSTPRLAGQTQVEMGLQRKQHRQLIADIANDRHGSVFDQEGDAYWIEFPSATDAVLAAIVMHQELRHTQAGKGENQRLAIRAVISVGDILHQENDTIGTTMSLTARIEKITPPDEIYLSHAAWLVLNKAEVQTSFVNKFSFKGFDEPEMIFKVDQKHRSRVLIGQYIIFTDARNFTRFVKSNSIDVVESFLLAYDDLINGACEKYGGIIRQVVGDQYFITFSEATSAMKAIELFCYKWRKIVESYKVGLAVGFHKGDLNIVRSYVYGDDIHTTMYLTELDRLITSNKGDISVITSGRIKDSFRDTSRQVKFQEIDKNLLKQEVHKIIVSEVGAFRYIVDDNHAP